MSDFLAWSGWVLTLISTVIAVLQYFQKEKYKKQVLKLNSENTSETYIATEKSIAMRENKGPINIR